MAITVLSLLLERTAEHACADTWRNVSDHLRRIQLAQLSSPHGTVWQVTDPTGTPVVRERVWVTFQPGEVRVCASCHGVNQADQIGRPAPTHKPEALRALLRHWNTLPK